MDLRKVSIIAIRRFFASEYGQEFFTYLGSKTPGIQKGLPHEIQFDAGYNQGYTRAMDVISEILSNEPDKEQNVENI